jgi:hypothetical protein
VYLCEQDAQRALKIASAMNHTGAGFFTSRRSPSTPRCPRTRCSRFAGAFDVNAYASYRDYGCIPSYQCDRNVLVEFELRRGYSSYSPLMGRTYGQTGQYGSSARASFQLPSCRFLERFRSQTYTIVMTAVAPNGQEKTSSRTVYQRSCR